MAKERPRFSETDQRKRVAKKKADKEARIAWEQAKLDAQRYKNVSAHKLDDLDAAVCEAIFEGWEPIGGVAIVGHHLFVQSMVRQTLD
jgi:hypothetical protein